jgi:leucyl-tRNA synthetase
LFEVWNDLRWYIQRKGNTDSKALADAVKVWLRLLAPFAPFTCEELWNRAGEPGFISVAEWPQVDAAQVDVAAEEQENFIIDLISDTLNILKATKIAPKHVYIYTAANWKWLVYLLILKKLFEQAQNRDVFTQILAKPTPTVEVRIGDVMRDLGADPTFRPHMKEAAGLFPKAVKTLNKLSNERKVNISRVKEMDEKKILMDALCFLRERFNAEVSIFGEEVTCYDPKGRAGMAMPGQPAIYIE